MLGAQIHAGRVHCRPLSGPGGPGGAGRGVERQGAYRGGRHIDVHAVARPRKARRTKVRQIPACLVVIFGYTGHYFKDIDYLGTQGHKMRFSTPRTKGVCVVSQTVYGR